MFWFGIIIGGAVVGLAWIGVASGILKKLLQKASNKTDEI